MLEERFVAEEAVLLARVCTGPDGAPLLTAPSPEDVGLVVLVAGVGRVVVVDGG